MSLFQCEHCGCCENTAVSPSYYLISFPESGDWTGIEDRRGKMLCSACGPILFEDGTATEWGEWHGEFDRVFLPKGMFKTNNEGNLEHIESGSTKFRDYEISEEEKTDGQKLVEFCDRMMGV